MMRIARTVARVESGHLQRVRFLAAGGLLLAVGVAVGLWTWSERGRAGGESTLPTTIAVLPLKPLASGDRDESIEIGIADSLITKLSALRIVTVRPIGSVRKFASLDQDPLAAGRELKVEAVLEGSLR